MSNGAPTTATSGRRCASSAAVATQSRELKVGRPTLSLSEVSLSEVSLSEVSLSEVSGSWGRSAIATGTSSYGPGRTRRPNSAAQGLRRRLTVTAHGDGSANATAAGAYWRSGAAVHRETTGLLSTGLLSTGLLSTGLLSTGLLSTGQPVVSRPPCRGGRRPPERHRPIRW